MQREITENNIFRDEGTCQTCEYQDASVSIDFIGVITFIT